MITNPRNQGSIKNMSVKTTFCTKADPLKNKVIHVFQCYMDLDEYLML